MHTANKQILLLIVQLVPNKTPLKRKDLFFPAKNHAPESGNTDSAIILLLLRPNNVLQLQFCFYRKCIVGTAAEKKKKKNFFH